LTYFDLKSRLDILFFSAQRAVHSKLALHSPVTFNWIINGKKIREIFELRRSTTCYMSLRCKGLSWLFISLTFTFSFKKEYSLSSKEKRRRTWNDVLLSFVSRRQWACYLPPNLDILSSFCVLCANTIITSFSFFVQKFWVQLKRQPRYSTRVKLSVWLIQFSSEKRISFQSEIYWERKLFSFFSQTNKRNVPIEIWSGF